MIAARRGRAPRGRAVFGAGGETGSVEFVETSATQAEFGEGQAVRHWHDRESQRTRMAAILPRFHEAFGSFVVSPHTDDFDSVFGVIDLIY